MYLSNMVIREAEEKDAAILSNLLAQLGYPTSVEESKERIAHHQQDGYKLFLAELSNVPIGFIALHWYRAVHHPEMIGRIVAFCIDEPFRDRGWGSKLLKYAEDFFRDKHCFKVELTSNLRRKVTHEYYLRKGFDQRSMHFVKVLTNSNKNHTDEHGLGTRS